MTSYISHPLIKKDSIESRLYQQVLAGDVLKKGNTMVVAPTALGKTIIAILVAVLLFKVFMWLLPVIVVLIIALFIYMYLKEHYQ